MIYFVGQAPSRKSKNNRGWAPGGASDALARMAGISYEDLTKKAEFLNLLPEWPGKSAAGDLFDLKKARLEADKIRQGLGTGDFVVFLGKSVAKAFGFKKPTYFVETTELGVTTVTMPHPSGINRWYNSKENRSCAQEFIRKILK